MTEVCSSYKRQRILHYECMGQRMNCLAIVFVTKLSLNRFIHLLNHPEKLCNDNATVPYRFIHRSLPFRETGRAVFFSVF